MATITLGEHCRITYSASQNVSKNTSTISITKVEVSTNKWTGSGGQAGGTIVINGQTVINMSESVTSGYPVNLSSSWNTIGNAKGTTSAITHNNDGTKSVSISATINLRIGSSLKDTVGGTGTIKLPQIARVSEISTSAVTVGSPMTIKVSKATSSTTVTVKYTCGTASGTIASKSDATSISWTPPLSLIEQASNRATVPITITATSYSGITSLGTDSVSVNCPIPVNTITAPAGTLGASLTISISRKHEQLTTSLAYECGSAFGSIVSTPVDSTSRNWTPPKSLATQVPNTSSAVITITATTWNGSAQVGTSTTKISAAVPTDLVPTISALELTDLMGHIAKYGAYVQNKSRVQVTVTAAGAGGSTIASYTIKVGDTTKSGNNATFDTSVAGERTVAVTVTDSRGRVSEAATDSITVLPYSSPMVVITGLDRCDEDGTDNPVGTYAKITFDATCYDMGLTVQTADYTLRHRERGTEEWTEDTLTDYDGRFSVEGGFRIIPAAADTQYEVSVAAADSFESVWSQIEIVQVAFVLFAADKYAQSVGIGRLPKDAGTVVVGMDLDADGNRLTNIGDPVEDGDAIPRSALLDLIYPIGSIYMSMIDTSPAEFLGGTWSRLENRFLLGASDSYDAGSKGGSDNHNHGLGAGYADIIFNNQSSKNLYIRSKSASFSANRSGKVSISSYSTAADGVSAAAELGGSTDTKTTLPPYLAVYMWQREA